MISTHDKHIVLTEDGEQINAKGQALANYAGPDVTVTIEEITPEIAADMLARKFKNRRISDYYVGLYAAEMSEGKWELNGEAIVLDDKGRCVDGQHRLAAIVMSGATIRSVVARGVTGEAFNTLDIGKSRRTQDYLDREGYANTARITTIVNNLMFYEKEGHIASMRNTGRIWGQQARRTPLPTEVLDYIKAHEAEVYDGLGYTNRMLARSPLRRTSMTGFSIALIILRRIDHDLADSFFEAFCTGQMIAEGEPAYALRNRFLNAASDSERIKIPETCALIFKAWNAERKGQGMKIASWKASEPFPTPL